jgi:hypothetical protein
MDDLCCVYGWALLTALARQHGDTHVQIESSNTDEPSAMTIQADADEDAYEKLCDDQLWALDRIRWWGSSGRWGIHGSRYFEVAVAGQVDDVRWPRITNCDVLSIDAAIRLARLARVLDELLAQMMATYDALSWDPALENESPVRDLADACRAVLADRIDPIVAIRRIVDLLRIAPKQIRRTSATAQLHKASGRTGYLLLGADRARFGPLLLAQNDRNHERHSLEEGPMVRRAAEEILSAIEQLGGP